MSLTLISPPAEEPVTLAELKEHLKISSSSEDAALSGFALAARQTIEARYGLSMIAQGWRLTLDEAPQCALTLPLSPILSVDSVGAMRGGVIEALAPDAYEAQAGAVGRVLLNAPLVTDRKIDGIVVAFTAGWPDAASVPEEFKIAVKTLAAYFYEQREGEASAPNIAPLLSAYRQVRL